ncbi:UNVERIFIED_CONTAM: hypothetical protein Scaly_0868300 [Sesamum calycinum]|uniref:Uncharacterized protein n=1 Tax=Sesamum calycinum TaxID=2727403 RepID=A0AAW2QVX9_9LAMI
MSKGEGKRSSKKCLAYVAAFVVFQTAVILVFALTVMKVKSPKVTIKNTNFGHFKYQNSTFPSCTTAYKLEKLSFPGDVPALENKEVQYLGGCKLGGPVGK